MCCSLGLGPGQILRGRRHQGGWDRGCAGVARLDGDPCHAAAAESAGGFGPAARHLAARHRAGDVRGRPKRRPVPRWLPAQPRGARGARSRGSHHARHPRRPDRHRQRPGHPRTRQVHHSGCGRRARRALRHAAGQRSPGLRPVRLLAAADPRPERGDARFRPHLFPAAGNLRRRPRLPGRQPADSEQLAALSRALLARVAWQWSPCRR